MNLESCKLTVRTRLIIELSCLNLNFLSSNSLPSFPVHVLKLSNDIVLVL